MTLKSKLSREMPKVDRSDLFRLAVVIPLAWLVLYVGYNADVSFYRGPNVAWYDSAEGVQRIEDGLAGDTQDHAD
jgi:hypothetical protein